MVVVFDVSWNFSLLDEVEDGYANVCHGDHAGSHVAKPAGGVDQHVILVVTGGVEACTDLVTEERVTELFTEVDVESRDGFGLFLGGFLHKVFY